MSETEKSYTAELFDIANRLPDEAKQRLIWICQGILFASNAKDGRDDR